MANEYIFISLQFSLVFITYIPFRVHKKNEEEEEAVQWPDVADGGKKVRGKDVSTFPMDNIFGRSICPLRRKETPYYGRNLSQLEIIKGLVSSVKSVYNFLGRGAQRGRWSDEGRRALSTI